MTNLEAYDRFKELGGEFNWDVYPPSFIIPIFAPGSVERADIDRMLAQAHSIDAFEFWILGGWLIRECKEEEVVPQSFADAWASVKRNREEAGMEPLDESEATGEEPF